MATLEDVAAVAGVAITTVSRALRNDATLKITADTRERILAAAQKVGYEQMCIRDRPESAGSCPKPPSAPEIRPCRPPLPAAPLTYPPTHVCP